MWKSLEVTRYVEGSGSYLWKNLGVTRYVEEPGSYLVCGQGMWSGGKALHKGLVEVCVYTVEDCQIAHSAGAKRVELCADVSAGGTTPSYGTIEYVTSHIPIDVAVMIRPRGGDFVYSVEEQLVMQRDILAAGRAGAKAVVFGALTQDGRVDQDVMRPLLDTAADNQLDTVFHRAFDVCRDPMEALDVLLELGVTRLLTSGQAKRSAEGLPMLKAILDYVGDSLEIMPGGGVASDHVDALLRLGVWQVHTGRSTTKPSPMVWHNDDVRMGAETYDDRRLRIADFAEIRAIVEKVEAASRQR